ncbi:MAG: NAD-dependent epimerase/dehydratase family protein [Deltaproteobacteria bacterium]|nr:NAD-dependent epimerase/dehydratase family protein [Deltaproteobacteria bacterium]
MSKQLRYYKEKTILITGAAGFIGSSLVRVLSQIDCTLICCCRDVEKLEIIPPVKARVVNREIDIRTPSIWEEILERVDVVFHFAAQTSSKFANDNPCMDMDINLALIARFVETCQNKNIRPDIIFPGTVTQVGLTQTWPIDEMIQDVPITVYDINKLAAEKYVCYYGTQLGGRGVTLRLANVYGPGTKSGRPDRGILNMMVMRALEGKPLTLYGDGNYVRDYVFIDDVVNAFLIAGARFDSTNGKHYVLGSGVGHTIKEMAEIVRNLMAKITGKNVDIQNVPPPHGLSQIEFRHFVANTSRFRQDTGWSPQVKLEAGIKRTIDSFLRKGTQ